MSAKKSKVYACPGCGKVRRHCGLCEPCKHEVPDEELVKACTKVKHPDVVASRLSYFNAAKARIQGLLGL